MQTKRMSRREFLLLAGAASGAVVLAACGQPTTQPTAAPTAKPGDTKVEPTAAPPAAEKVKIEFLGEPGGTEWREEEKAKFEGENSNIEWIQVEQAEGVSRLEQLLSLVAAGTPPDCARVESDVYRTFCKDKLLLSLDNYIASDAEMSKPDYWIQPQEKDRCSYEGQWYGIGACWVAPHFYYNRSLFEELGVEPPSNDPDEAWDWEKFLDVARELTVDANGKHPNDSGFDVDRVERWGVYWPTWWIPLHAAVQSNGVDWVDPETQQIVLDKPEAMEALQRIADLTLVHHVAPTAASFDALGMGEAEFLETKKVALYNTGSWSVNWLWEIEGGLGTGVLPKMTRPATDMQAHLITIVKDTKHPDEAWKLIRFLSLPWFQERYCKNALWLPSQTALMTDTAIANWCTPPEHPEGYDLIVTEYTAKYGHYLTMPVGYAKANETALTPVFDQIWIGDAKVADVLPAAVEEANRIMKEEQAR
ncbi:MAG TPA: extracellular solute-binding protein [Anaerolineae bacterium]|nr:extracellular solute-binding protein [Anaerolineae bacterium]